MVRIAEQRHLIPPTVFFRSRSVQLDVVAPPTPGDQAPAPTGWDADVNDDEAHTRETFLSREDPVVVSSPED